MFKINKYYIFIIFTFISNLAFSQGTISPDGILFQAIARDANGNAAVSRTVYAKVSILKGSAAGTSVYAESFEVTSSPEGIFTIIIGKGNRTSGVSNLAAIDWGGSIHFLNLKVAIAPTLPSPNWDANNEYIDLGTSQFWSVPYTLFATKSNYADSTSTITSILPGEKGGTGINNKGKTITLGNNIITRGVGDLTITTTAASNVIFPTEGLLATTQFVADKIGTDTVSLSNRINAIGLANGNTAALKLNISDTSSMLSRRFARDTISLSNRIARDSALIVINKQAIIDTAAALRQKINDKIEVNQFPNLIQPFLANTIFSFQDTMTLSNRIDKKINITDTSSMLLPYAIRSNTEASLNLKEDLANKSLDVIADANSDIKFPSVKAVKTFVDNSININRATDATTISKGIVQLAGDLSGTADLPTVSKIGGKSIALGGSLLTAGNITTTGNYSTTINTTGNTNLTLPITGTLATLNGTESLTNKRINGVTPTALTTGFTIAGGTMTNTTLTVIGDVTIGGVNSGDQLITLVGDVSGSGTGTFSTTIANGAIDNNKIAASANITDTKLATIATSGKVLNSATSATSSNTANTIVARDASGNFSAGIISAALAGNASTTTALQTPRNIYGNLFDGTANLLQVIAPNFGGTGVDNGTKTLTLGGNINTGGLFSTAGDLIVSGNYSTTFTSVGNTNVTFPTTGTLATLDGVETLTNKTLTSPIITTPIGLVKSDIGLSNVDNTSDLSKPISTATQLALNLKANTASPTFTGTVSGITKAMVGLGNVDNTSDLNKPISIAVQNALDLKQNILDEKADINSPTFTGTVSGITKAMIGLGNVDNTSDLNKPISTATQAALDLKEALANKSLDITTDANSDLKYPSVKSVKTYVDNTVLNNRAGDATTTAKGIVQLAGDLGGTAALPLVNKIGGKSVTLGGSLSTDGYFATSGNFSTTLIATGNTSLTLPLSGTLATLNGSESLTNKIINGVTPTALANGFTIAGGTSTNTTLTVIGDVTIGGVNSGDQLISLIGDVAGSGTGTFTTTINSVGGISSSTIATLPTLVASNTASITTNTANIISNTASITSLQTRVASNTTSITSLESRVTANTSSITTNTNDIALRATIASPSFTGTPTAPTAATGTNTTQIATTQFVLSSITNSVTPDADATTKGKLKLAGDLSGTADLPTIAKIGGKPISLGGNLLTANDFTVAGNFSTTLTATGNTNITLPLTGTIATLAGTESLTNKTINGITPTALATGFTIAGGTSTNTTLTVIGDVTVGGVNSGDQLITLTGDVTGSGTGTFSTTIHSVGGVSSATISTLPGAVTTNTANIATNTSSITANTNAITANTASITSLQNNVVSNTASITINTNNIASNTLSITSLQSSVAANTASITANTAAITVNTNNITSNTASITTLETIVTSNTASITANTNDIALRATIASPSFTGTPTAPTAAPGTSTTQIATTAFVTSIVGGSATPDADATTKGKLQLTNDLGGTAAAPTVVNVGGISASTIGSLPTLIASNTASITTLDSKIISNTASITANTASIATNTANIITNSNNITTNANNISTNTSNIASLQTTVASNTASITSLQTKVAANTASITTNINDIALRATIASPSFTGTPTAPTAAAGTSNTQIATTAFVTSIVGGSATPDADASTKGKIQLTNDLGGTAAAPTVNSVGGVSSSTIAGLPTLIASNTASITANTSSIVTNTNNIAANTANIAANTSSITTLQTTVTANTSSITSLQTSVAANTASITANTNSIATNAANIAANTSNIATNTSNISTNTTNITSNTNNIASNTASITALQTSIAANTASITALDTRVTTNTASITANTSAIALRATIASPSFTGTPTAPTPQDGTNDTQIATTAFVQNIVSSSVQSGISASATPDATASTKGKIKLTNDLGGTADLPTVNSIGGVSSTTISNFPSDIALRATIASPSFTGTPTAPTAAPGTSTNQIATTAYVASVVGGSATPDADASTKGKIQLANDLGGTAAAPTINSVGGVNSSTIATIPSSIASNTASITANTNSIAINTTNIATNTLNISSLQTSVASHTASITSLETKVAANTVSITTNTNDIALRATIASPSFTGTPTAPTAAPGTSTTQIATTAFVASVVGGSATPDADAVTKGKIQLTNDLGGTAAAPTVNSVGGVSSATIASLPTSVASNTASITLNTNSIATNTTNITANTSNIASNTSSITNLQTSVASNTVSITSLETRVTANTASITANSTDIATNTSEIALRATISSPSFTGTPTAPTPAAGTSNTQIATTAFVASVVGGSATPDADASTKGKIQLTNDLGGTASAPIVNSVGGVSSATIATLNTNITAATSSNTANTIVKRDANGDFAAGMITANLTGNVTGNASTATKLANARTIFGNTFDGSSDITGQLSPAYGGTGVNNGSNTLTLGGSMTTIGSDALSLTVSGTTSLTLPSSGTVATLEGAESISGLKTFGDQKIAIKGSGAGSIILSSSNTTGSNYTLTLPSLTATIATLSGTESLTNKTIVSPVITNPTGIVSSDVGLGNVNNTSDADKPVSTAQQTALDLKEALSNKSTSVTTDGASDTKYPSAKAVKTYVDTQIASSTVNDATTSIKGIIKLGGDLAGTGTSAATPIITDAAITTAKIADDAVTSVKVLNGAITTAKLADGAVTNAKITSMSATKLTGIVPSTNGGAGTLNGVLQADGNGNVSVATAGTDYATPSQVASNYLPLSGGTLTGALNGTTATFTGALTAGGITFPTSDGTAGQLLVTNGSGTLTWSSGALSVGAIAGSSNAKGATISTNVLSLTPADATNGGIVTTAAQTFAGAKTFSATTTIADVTDATNTTDGALIVAGGASIAKNLYIGGLTASKAVFTDANKGLTSTGVVEIAQGGTGASTKLTAFDALSPMTTAGDLIYGGTSGSGTRLGVGAANTILRSNGSAPVWGAVTLTTDVTGILPIANGGTGSATQNFVDLTTAQTIAGSKTFSGTTIVNGSLSVSGTNAFTAGGTAYPTVTGTVGQVLTISSAGTASWTSSTGTSVRDVVDETGVAGFAAAAAGATTFTLSQIPNTNSKVKMYINGIRITNNAYSVNYTTKVVTYTPANNGNYAIILGDRIQFDYFY